LTVFRFQKGAMPLRLLLFAALIPEPQCDLAGERAGERGRTGGRAGTFRDQVKHGLIQMQILGNL